VALIGALTGGMICVMALTFDLVRHGGDLGDVVRLGLVSCGWLLVCYAVFQRWGSDAARERRIERYQAAWTAVCLMLITAFMPGVLADAMAPVPTSRNAYGGFVERVQFNPTRNGEAWFLVDLQEGRETLEYYCDGLFWSHCSDYDRLAAFAQAPPPPTTRVSVVSSGSQLLGLAAPNHEIVDLEASRRETVARAWGVVAVLGLAGAVTLFTLLTMLRKMLVRRKHRSGT